MSVISTSLSGLQAASLRLGNSANNIANIHSTRRVENGQVVDAPYQAMDVRLTSREPQAGVQAHLALREPSSIPVYDPAHAQANAEGLVQYPNVSPEHEQVQSILARQNFMANVNAIQAAEKMDDTLLDIRG